MGAERPRGRDWPDVARTLPAVLATAVSILAVLGSGCGQQAVVVDVDLLSFVGEEELVANDYTVPAGTVLPEPQTLEPQQVTLVEGLNGIVEMESVTLTLGVGFDHQQGEATVRLRLYLAGASAGAYVYDTAPVLDETVALTAGSTQELPFQIASTPENGLVEAFESGGLTFGLAVFIDAQGSGDDVAGTWSLAAFEALVLGRGDLLP